MYVRMTINREKAIQEGFEYTPSVRRNINLTQLSPEQRKVISQMEYHYENAESEKRNTKPISDGFFQVVDLCQAGPLRTTPNLVTKGFIVGYVSDSGLAETRILLDLRKEMLEEENNVLAEQERKRALAEEYRKGFEEGKASRDLEIHVLKSEIATLQVQTRIKLPRRDKKGRFIKK